MLTLNDNMITFESSFDFNMNMKILIILKMLFLVLSTILGLMLVSVSVNYFVILSCFFVRIIHGFFYLKGIQEYKREDCATKECGINVCEFSLNLQT